MAAMTARFDDALAYASSLHREQLRKGAGIPYISHLLAVASIVLEARGSEDEAIAALLHDAPEDQGGWETLHHIERLFGSGVAKIVEHCSDTFEKNKPDWKPRKVAYLQRLAGADTSTLLVSAADKLHNARATLRDLEAERRGDGSVWGRFSASRDQTLWYYDELVAAYQGGVADERREPIVRELSRTVAALKHW